MATTSLPSITTDTLQRAVTESPEGPVIILGGPGTGKTHSMLGRIAALLKGNASPHTITYLTFSSRGAEDMRRLLHNHPETEEAADHIFTGTVHHYASHFLRQAGARSLGISPHYTIWDHEQAMEAMIELTDANREDDTPKVPTSELDRILRWHAINQALDPQEAIPPDQETWSEIINLYINEKKQQNILDIDDLIPTALEAMKRDPDTKTIWNKLRSRHLLVDEFQDITPRQYQLINMMTGPTNSIVISADTNQSIYAWRGADARLVEQFRLQHSQAESHLLRVNHRASKVLAAVATGIADNPAMTGLVHDYQTGVKLRGKAPTLYEYSCDHHQMDNHIIHSAKALTTNGYALEDIAFIYRTRTTINRLSNQLLKQDIPHTILGEPHRRPDTNVRRIISLLTCVLNPLDRKAFAEAAATDTKNKSKQLNSQAYKEISKIARNDNVDMFQAARQLMTRLTPGTTIHQDIRYVTGALENIKLMLDDPEHTINNICRRAENLLLEAQNVNANNATQDPAVVRLMILSETISKLRGETPRQHLSRFLELLKTSLYPEHRSEENDDPLAHHQGITCTTIHASKGLQWKAVWVLDANDHIMPGDVNPSDDSKLHEEQRIFYVASTRATDILTYTYNTQPTKQCQNPAPSRFLDCLSSHLEFEHIEITEE